MHEESSFTIKLKFIQEHGNTDNLSKKSETHHEYTIIIAVYIVKVLVEKKQVKCFLHSVSETEHCMLYLANYIVAPPYYLIMHRWLNV